MTTKAFATAVLAAALAVGTACPTTALASTAKPHEGAKPSLTVSLETERDGTIKATVENHGEVEAERVSLKLSAPEGTALEKAAEPEPSEVGPESPTKELSGHAAGETTKEAEKRASTPSKAGPEKKGASEEEAGGTRAAIDGKPGNAAVEPEDERAHAESDETKDANVLKIDAGDLEAGGSATFEVSATMEAAGDAKAVTVVAKATAQGAKASYATARLSAEGDSGEKAAEAREAAAEADPASPKPSEASALAAAEDDGQNAEPRTFTGAEATPLATASASEASFEIGTSSDVTDAKVGDAVRIVVRVRNTGGAEARNVLTRSAIPKGMAVVDGSVTEGGRADTANGFVEWSAPTIAAGSWMEYSYEATVTQAMGAVTTQASCEADAAGKAGTAATLANASQAITITTAGGAAVDSGQPSAQDAATSQETQASEATALPKTGDGAAGALLPASTAALAAAAAALALRRGREGDRP